jgi:small subunit ribosomal protein S16
MATRIRLARRGRKGRPVYDIVVAPSTAKRDGRFIEKLGTYDPNHNPAYIILNEDRALYWLMVGAQPSDTTRSLLSTAGVLLRKHLQVGVNKGAITQDVADSRYQAWLSERTAKLGKAPFESRAKK